MRFDAFVLLSVVLVTVPFGTAVPQEAPPVALSGVASLPAAMTGLQLESLLDGVIRDLQNAGITLEGEAGIQVNGVAADLNTQTTQLRALIGDKIDQPLVSLGADVQSAATRLYNATIQISKLLSHQQKCLSLNANLFLSGIRSVVANLKTAVPFAPNEKPSLVSYSFDSTSIAFVVPPNAGRFTVTGFNLWHDNQPGVTLQTEDRSKIIATLQAQRAASDDSFSAAIDPSLIAQYSGACLDLKVIAYQTSWILWFIPIGKTATEIHLPMCISPDYQTTWLASASFDATNTVEGDLGTRAPYIFYFDNPSCEDRHTVSGSHAWPDVTGDQHIVNIDQSAGSLMNNQSNVGLSITGNNVVSAAGWLDTASCINAFFGRKLLHSTIYQEIVTPHVSGPISVDEKETSSSGQVATVMPQTQICVDVPKNALTTTTVWWMTLKQLQAKKRYTATDVSALPYFFESPRVTAGKAASAMPQAAVGGYSIDAQFNPVPVGGKAQMCTTIQIPTGCDY